MDYKQAYLKLFNSITDVVEELKSAQTEAEAIVIGETSEEKEHTREIVVLLSKLPKT
jgi:hypothetical protein